MSKRILQGPVKAIFSEAIIGRLATITPGGRPHVAPYWYASDGERIVISTLANQTVRNLEANPDCAFLVDLGSHFRDLRGAQIRGRATLHRGDATPNAVLALRQAIDRVHAAEIITPEFSRYLEWETRASVTIEIAPESATWFDLGHQRSGRRGSSMADRSIQARP